MCPNIVVTAAARMADAADSKPTVGRRKRGSAQMSGSPQIASRITAEPPTPRRRRRDVVPGRARSLLGPGRGVRVEDVERNLGRAVRAGLMDDDVLPDVRDRGCALGLDAQGVVAVLDC